MKLGIDFGTCFSFVAACIGDNVNNAEPLIGKDDKIHNDLNGIPTVFYHDSNPDHCELVGQKAYDLLLEKGLDKNGVQHIKSLLRKKSPDDVVLRSGGKTFTVKQIVVKILAFLIKNAAYALDRQHSGQNLKLDYLVITVPASAGADSYRGLLRDFAFEAVRQIAIEAEQTVSDTASNDDKLRNLVLKALRASEFSLDSISLIDEPVAVALSYYINSDRNVADGERILTYDLGGGTFDVAIVEYTPSNSSQKFSVLAQGGAEVGGNDWDSRLLQLALKNNEPPIAITNPAIIEYDKRLMKNVISAKLELSRHDDTPFASLFNGKLVASEIERTAFEDETSDLLEKTVSVLNNTIEDFENRLDGRDKTIHAVVFSGGASLMPMVKNRIKPLMEERYPNIDVYFASPDRTIAFGAAIYACQPDQTVLVSPHTYGIECLYKPENDTGLGSFVTMGAGNILRPVKPIEAASGESYCRIHNILLKGTPIDPHEGYISGEENYCPILPDQQEMSIRVFEIKESLNNQKWIDIDERKDMFRIVFPITQIKSKSILERSYSVKIRLLQGGILELFVYDNDRNRQLVKYAMARL